MKTRFDDPWIATMSEQLWRFEKASEVVLKCADPRLVLDPQALHDCCAEPPDRRLNPLEFHGRRCDHAPRS